MNLQDFIKHYVIAYVSDKMARVNRNEVQNENLPEKHTAIAINEGMRL